MKLGILEMTYMKMRRVAMTWNEWTAKI